MSTLSRPDTVSPARCARTALRVALLEDDDVLRDRVLLPGLQRHGFEVMPLRTIGALHALLQSASVELIVLDIGLPDGDGFTLTQQLQAMRPALGIVILSGRGDQPDRLRGLSQGADAYLVKPVEIEMLAATLFSVARRLTRGPAGASVQPGGIAHAPWQLQDDGWCLFAPDGSAVPLTGSERLVMQCLWQSSGRLVTRSALLTVLGDSLGMEIDPHRLDALLHRLRQKVLERSGAALPLTSVRGAGYLLMPRLRAPTADA
ncbi:response regulator transcription factor [Xanthomonas bromi]|uniref:response regulator transcription factor n=1 Tax=Xanthomonas bromi TaxID=56449 RepID=UPI000A013799|nr:response regulator transcription factor [Xanthomonas bromi]